MKTNEILNKYKEKICPFCVHYNDKEYQECKIVVQIDGEANCVNYKCSDYCRKKVKDERNNSTK